MIRTILFGIAFLISSVSFTQTVQEKLHEINLYYEQILAQKDSIKDIRESLMLERIIEKIHEFGLPEIQEDEELICHSAMCLVFDHDYRLAKWVIHILTPDIIEGRVTRTNDFRPDPKIEGTAVEADYFLKYEQEDGSYKYDGFGYDRGHLAPSADFRWAEQALSESYYYSNITPQTPEFNREKWAEIEGFLRTYIYNNPDSYLYIVTAPVLRAGLPIIERGVNQLPIPEYHYKIAVDYNKKTGIAFLVPQENLIYPIDWYAVTIDSIQSITGINFFANLPVEDQKQIKYAYDMSKWHPEDLKDQVRPLRRVELPPNTYNTVEAREMVDYHRDVTVCGTVVSTHRSGRGNVFLNLDQAFPNQIFTITIWSRDVVNFDYEPELFFKNKKVCVTGRVTQHQGSPGMSIGNSRNIQVID